MSDDRSEQRAALRESGRDGAAVLAGSAISTAAGFTSSVIITRSFNTDAAGVVFAATSLFLLLYTVSKLGTGAGSVRMLAQYRAHGEQHRLWATLRAGLVPVIGVATLAGIGLALAAPWVSRVVLDAGSDAVGAIRLLGLLLPFAAASDFGVAASRGFAIVAPMVAIDKVVRPIAQLALVGAAAFAGLTAESVIVLWALPYVVTAGWSLAWLARLTRADIAAMADHRSKVGGEWREFWSFTWSRSVGVMTQVVLKRADLILLSALRGPAEAAIYAAATRFMVVGQLIGTSFSLAVQPRLGRHAALGDFGTVRVLYRVGAVWLVLTAWPLYIMLIAWAPLLLSIFGDEYVTATSALVVLAMAMLVATAIGPVDQVLIMAGRSTWVLANSIVSLVANIALNLALIPPLGALGAALAWSLSILLSNLIPGVQLFRWKRLHPLSQSLALAAACATGVFGGASMVTISVLGQTWLGLLSASLFGLVTYLVLLARIGHRLDLDASPLARFLPMKPSASRD